ncbi:MAG: hypothetical protein OES47_07925 [Acidobacteriota bacterium]|nr:hypothetical protein [Acidobacteriota bacterium]
MPDALRFLVLMIAGWLTRQQEDLIDYLREENRVLREQLGSRPPVGEMVHRGELESPTS